MCGARRARATPAALDGGRPRHSPPLAVNTATGPVEGERQAPPRRPPLRPGCNTATSTLPVVAALLGGSQAPSMSGHVKPFARQIGVISAWQGAPTDRATREVGLTFSL